MQSPVVTNLGDDSSFGLQAATSELRPRQPFGVAEVEELFGQFLADAESVILFLNHVEQIDVLVWDDGAAAPRLMNRIKVSGADLVRDLSLPPLALPVDPPTQPNPGRCTA